MHSRLEVLVSHGDFDIPVPADEVTVPSRAEERPTGEEVGDPRPLEHLTEQDEALLLHLELHVGTQADLLVT